MTGSTTPLARAVRTLLQAETGVLVTAVGADWVANTRASAVILALGTIAALLAGIVAYLVALGSHAATTPLGKAIASAAQFAGAGLATVGLADLTNAAAISFGHTVLKVVIAAVLTGVVTLAQTSAEQQSSAPAGTSG